MKCIGLSSSVDGKNLGPGISTPKTQKSQKSQKSTSNTNKKSHRRKSGHDSQIYNSNIVIVHDEEEESCGDPIEKEVEKLKKLMAKNRRKKKKGTSKSSKSYSASSK
jgi:ribosome-associated translation inhibitor RaiA